MYAMKSRFLLILLAALYTGAGAHAATVAVSIDGQAATTYTLNGLSIDGNGNANVSATTIGEGGGETPPPVTPYTLTYTAGSGGSITGTAFQTVSAGGSGTAVTATASSGYTFASWSDGLTTASRTDSNVQANLSVTANFSVVVSGNCPTPGSNVQIIDTKVTTGSPTVIFPKTDYTSLAPSTIQAFKFTTPSDTSKVYSGQASSARMTGSPSAKLVVVSECPGDVRVDDKPYYCGIYGYEGSSVYTVVNVPPTTRACVLQPGKVYYANMVAQNRDTVGSSTYTCSNALTCSHSAYIK
jgi:hypothetical protein